ncbi:ATPase family gene 2 protein homolog A [Hetaerina americana]|uniref:ATPase family gene 2 protein homolog A n=1 Tax=Hetaerina americana TaxID=62018 RepID=UPI003A7F2A66
MPPKSKKSVSSWQACERCGVILSTKDLQTHVNVSCVIDKDGSLVHGFIKNAVIIGYVEGFHADECTKYIPAGESSHYVYVSESAMQLCDIVIGGHALIKHPRGTVVRPIWPMYERTLTSIMMTEEGLVSLGLKAGARLSVEKLPVPPLAAASVTIQPVSPSVASSFTLQILSVFSKIFLGKVLLEGNILCARHYGQRLYFIVSKCSLLDDDGEWTEGGGDVLEVMERVGQLHLADQCKIIPFSVNVGTKFQLAESNVKTRNLKSLSFVGGLDDIIGKLREFLDMAWNPDYSNLGVERGHGCLLLGPPGTGKTMLVRALAAEASAAFIEVLGSEVYSKYVGEAEARLRGYFTLARERAPALVFLDELDALCPVHHSEGSRQEQRISATLLSLLDALSKDDECSGGVVVIGATSRPLALDPRLRRPGRLELELELPVPGPVQRLDILERVVGGWGEGVRLGDDASLERVAQATHGHVGADLASVCAHAVSVAVKRGGHGGVVVVGNGDWEQACMQVKPSAMREVMVEVPNVHWSDIGGQDELKLKLRQAVEWPLRYPQAFTRLGICPPKGLLMFGPPGCSKTMVAKALATESGLNFISIKGPELFSKWVGESERAVREVFRRARQVAPAVVFFDELDALGGERGSSREGGAGGSSVQERVLAQLLTEMDGVTPLSQVTIVAATNRPDRIDKALLRPGRLDQIVYVPLPDESTRREILMRQFAKSRFADDISLDEVIDRTKGYSGAEVVAVCQEAGLNALEDDIHAECIMQHHVEKALNNVKPRTSQYLLDLYETYVN